MSDVPEPPGKKARGGVLDWVVVVAILAVSALIVAGIAIHLIGQQGAGPDSVADAASRGDIETLRRFLDGGADPNDSIHGYTALYWAASSGRPGVVDMLIEAGAGVNRRSYQGWTPLHCAASRRIALRLLDAGADINIANKDGWTPLHWAVSENHEDIVELLMARGASIDAITGGGRTPLHLVRGVSVARRLTEAGASVNVADNDAWTPLHCAVSAGCRDVVELFIACGADVNTADNEGKTPIEKAKAGRSAGIAELLQRSGAR